MGDAGEGLVDAEGRAQERMDELARERAERQEQRAGNLETARELKSWELARADLLRQIETSTHPRRRAQLDQALAELDRRLAKKYRRPAQKYRQSARRQAVRTARVCVTFCACVRLIARGRPDLFRAAAPT